MNAHSSSKRKLKSWWWQRKTTWTATRSSFFSLFLSLIVLQRSRKRNYLEEVETSPFYSAAQQSSETPIHSRNHSLRLPGFYLGFYATGFFLLHIWIDNSVGFLLIWVNSNVSHDHVANISIVWMNLVPTIHSHITFSQFLPTLKKNFPSNSLRFQCYHIFPFLFSFCLLTKTATN